MKVHCTSLWNRDQWRFILLWHNVFRVKRYHAPWRSEHFWVVALAGWMWFIEWGRPGAPPEELFR